MRRFTDEEIGRLADHLNGSSQSIDGAVAALFPGRSPPWYCAAEDDCATLDDLVFECDVCNWWFGVEDMVDSQTCVDCSGATVWR